MTLPSTQQVTELLLAWSQGEESLFLRNVEFCYWAMAERGIYFVTEEDREYTMKFIDFEKRQVTPIAGL